MERDEEHAWLNGRRFQPVGVIEPSDVAVQLEPVRPTTRRPRWLVPVVSAIVLVLTVSLAGVWALSSALPTGANDATRDGYAYLPGNTTVAMELRLDLPAGQRDQLGTFLSRFPGFGAASTAESRLVGLLDDLV